MPHILDKHYNDFGGVDTRTNKFAQSPQSARDGRNFMYSTDDELIKRFGFQSKSSDALGAEAGLIEYKYTDSLTGESLSEILGVGSDGMLRRMRSDLLTLTFTGSSVGHISIYNNATNYYIDFLDSSYAQIGSVTFDETTTIAGLKTLIDALSITSLVVVGTSTKKAYLLTSCWQKPVQASESIEVNYFEAIASPSSSVHFPEVVDRLTKDPDFEGASFVNINNACYITCGGFPMKYDGETVHRAGIPKMMACDFGAGSTRTRNMSGFELSAKQNAGGFSLANGYYAYRFQYYSVDANGVEVVSKIDTSLGDMVVNQSLSATGSSVKIVVPKITNDDRFPVYSAQVKKLQKTAQIADRTSNVATILVGAPNIFNIGDEIKVDISDATYNSSDATYPGVFTVTNATFDSISYSNTGSNSASAPVTGTVYLYRSQTFSEGFASTIDVETGHNIQPGMFLRWPLYYKFGSQTNGESRTTNKPFFYLTKVTAVTSTTITTAGGFDTSGGIGDLQGSLWPGQIINAQFYPDDIENKIDGKLPEPTLNKINVAAGVKIWRSKKLSASGRSDLDNFTTNGVYIGDFYFIGTAPLSHQVDSYIYDDLDDVNLKVAFADNLQGEELPRACKYLSKWLDLIVQGGRPYKYISNTGLDYATSLYPSFRSSTYPFVPGSSTVLPFGKESTYTEAHLCDYQSIYWSDSSNFEGFSQSGLAETRIDTTFNDTISGFAPNKDAFFVFKDRSTAVLVGTPSIGDVSVEVLESDTGCASHNSIQEINGALVWLDAVNGFVSCVAGRLPTLIGYPVNNFMRENSKLPNAQKLRFKAAKACNYRLKDLYVCYVPCGTIDFDGTTLVPSANSSSKMFVFDYSEAKMGQIRRCWYLWDSIQFTGGLLAYKDSIYGSTGLALLKNRNTNSKYDYSDDKTAITFQYKSAWLHYNYPSIDKRFIQWIINSIQGGFGLTIKQHGNYIDNIISDISITFPAYSVNKLQTKQTIHCPIPKLAAASVEFLNAAINEDVRINGFEIEVSNDNDFSEVKYG